MHAADITGGFNFRGLVKKKIMVYPGNMTVCSHYTGLENMFLLTYKSICNLVVKEKLWNYRDSESMKV